MARQSRQAARDARGVQRAANSQRKKRRRTGKKTLYYLLLVLFLLAAGATLSLTTFFKIKSIGVVGLDQYAPDEIARASGIVEGDNLLRIPVKKIEADLLERFPYIETVQVRRKFPSMVEIRAVQSVPGAALVEGQDVIIITLEGKVLERSPVFVPEQVPVVQGISASGAAPGQMLGEEAQEGLRMLRYLFEAAESTGFGQISNVDLRNLHNMMFVYENRLLIVLGTESNLEHKLNFATAVMGDMEPGEEGRIDVSGYGNGKLTILKRISLEEALALAEGREPEAQQPLENQQPEEEENSESEPEISQEND